MHFNRFLAVIAISLLALAVQPGHAADEVAAQSALAKTVASYWYAVSKRDWETTFGIDLEPDSTTAADGEGKSSEAGEADEVQKAVDAALRKQDYFLRKGRALGNMIGYEVVDVSVDDDGRAGSATVRIRKPIPASMGHAHKQVEFVDQWTLEGDTWRRLGPRGPDAIDTSIVAAPGVKTVKSETIERRPMTPREQRRPIDPDEVGDRPEDEGAAASTDDVRGNE